MNASPRHSWAFGLLITVTALLVACSTVSSTRSDKTYDPVIYGGSSAAIAAAVQVKKMGGSVVIIEPWNRIGGLTTGGLGQTDIGNKHVIGGLSRDFYKDIKTWYDRPEAWTAMPKPEGNFRGGGQTKTDPNEDTLWTFEPSTALGVYRNWIKAHGIEIVYGERLARTGEGKARDRGDGYWIARRLQGLRAPFSSPRPSSPVPTVSAI